jgi:hypothetical protein
VEDADKTDSVRTDFLDEWVELLLRTERNDEDFGGSDEGVQRENLRPLSLR